MKNPEENKKPPIEKSSSSTTTTQENTGESTQDSDDAVPSTSAQAAGYCPGAIPTPEIDLENLATEYIVLLAEEMAVELGTAASWLEKACNEIMSDPDFKQQCEELGLSEEEKATEGSATPEGTPSTSTEEGPVDLDEAVDFCRTLLTCEMGGDPEAAWEWLDKISNEMLQAPEIKKERRNLEVYIQEKEKVKSEERVKAEPIPRKTAQVARQFIQAYTIKNSRGIIEEAEHKKSQTPEASHTETAVVLEPGEVPEVALVITLDYEGQPVLSPTTTPGSPEGLPVLSTSSQHSSTSPASTSSIACSPPSRSPYTSSGEGTKALCRPPKLEPKPKTQPEEGAARTRPLHRPPRATTSPYTSSGEGTKALCRPPKLEPKPKTQPEEGAARTRPLHRPPRATTSPYTSYEEDTTRTQPLHRLPRLTPWPTKSPSTGSTDGTASTQTLHRLPRLTPWPTKSPSTSSTDGTARTQEEAVPKQKEGGKRSQKRRRHESDEPSSSLTAGVASLSGLGDPGEGPSSSLSGARQRQTSKRARQ